MNNILNQLSIHILKLFVIMYIITNVSLLHAMENVTTKTKKSVRFATEGNLEQRKYFTSDNAKLYDSDYEIYHCTQSVIEPQNRKQIFSLIEQFKKESPSLNLDLKLFNVAINSCFKSKNELISILDKMILESVTEQEKILAHALLDEIHKATVTHVPHLKSEGNHLISCNKWCRSCDTLTRESCNIVEAITDLIAHTEKIKNEDTHSLILQLPEKLFTGDSFAKLQDDLYNVREIIRRKYRLDEYELVDKLAQLMKKLFVYWSN